MATNLANFPTLWSGVRNRRRGAQEIEPTFEYGRNGSAAHLSSILDEFGPFPPYSMLVGQCLDGLPFMIGLDNPRSGAMLVVGDNIQAKSQILTAMGISTCRINRPEEVSWVLITRNPHRYGQLQDKPHCLAVINPHDRLAGEMVIEMASVVEQRRFGRERGNTQVLMIDDFQSFTPMLSDYSVYLNLKSLVSKGPGKGIWPLISVQPDDAYTEQGQLLRSFGTFIFEKKPNELSPPPIQVNGRAPVVKPDFNVIVGGRLIPISSLAI